MRDKAIQLAEEPYRALDPTRLKLSGEVQWDCRPCLSDLFYLPFVEPRINEFEVQPPADLCPDMSSVVFSDVIGLCKVWDVRGLLRLFPFEDGPSDLRRCCKVFNNYKNASADRQIGDRRYQNFLEGRIPGPSRFLPSGASLLTEKTSITSIGSRMRGPREIACTMMSLGPWCQIRGLLRFWCKGAVRGGGRKVVMSLVTICNSFR